MILFVKEHLHFSDGLWNGPAEALAATSGTFWRRNPYKMEDDGQTIMMTAKN
tara:strand:+ start:217 stop:372 length:156 start_codon:yes stop_codon:yes gene_type:complete